MKKYLKKSSILFLFGFMILGFGIFGLTKIKAATPTDVIFDYECQRKTLISTTGKDAAGNPKCNLFCSRALIYDGNVRKENVFCKYNTVDQAVTIDTFVAIDYFVPPEDAILIYLRAGLLAFFSVAALAVVLYGLYGWYVRSMSAGDPEKVELSMKIYKNAVIGLIIVFCSLALIQIIYLLVGLSSSPFDFNFIPRICQHCDVKESDLGRKCWSTQMDINGVYTCSSENVWE